MRSSRRIAVMSSSFILLHDNRALHSRFVSCCVISLVLLLPNLPLSAQTTTSPPEPTREVQALLNRADQATKIYHWQEALRLYDQALEKSRVLKDGAGEASTLNNIGLVYASIGQPQKALEYYERALPTSRAAGDKREEAVTLTNI